VQTPANAMAVLRVDSDQIDDSGFQGCDYTFIGCLVDVSKGATFKFDVSGSMLATYIVLLNVRQKSSFARKFSRKIQ
jgi:hypothetical protein